MSALKAPFRLHQLVRATFAEALSDGELHYFPTQVAILTVDSVPFQLRFSPALANKPKGPPPDPSQPRKHFDPFANPSPALFIASIGPSHNIVLNKFAVVPEHFILATRQYKPQTHVLEESDLDATRACIEAYEQERTKTRPTGQNAGETSEERSSKADGLFAFFNGGDHSGASQPHRHIQLLPVARMKDGLQVDSAWGILASSLDTLQRAPFVTFAEAINMDMSASDLYAAYLRLYRRACRAVAQHTRKSSVPDEEWIPAVGEARISYNMAMTRDTLVVCPRLSEGAKIETRDGAGTLGSLSLNGTLLAGTALVKNEAEWEALRNDPQGLLDVLKTIGIPRHDLNNEESSNNL